MTVEIRNITRRFGNTAALDDVTLALRPGEFVALLGPSGSGKTTLLRILAGLDHPESGTVSIDGRAMAGVAARERGVGVVFQNYALFRHMTVFENVAFGLRVQPRGKRPGRAAIDARVEELLALVQIPELARRYPDQISGGQRQRVALARALAIAPPLLLLDEPFGALDAVVRRSVRRWLRGLHDELGITSILVTHDQEEAMEMADRVAVMERGRIVQCDTPTRLLAAPATPFVAGFLGDAMRVEAFVAQGVLHFGALPLPPLQVALPDGPAAAFLQPGHVTAAPPDPLLSQAAEIQLLRALPGGELRAIVRLGELSLDAAVAQPAGWAQRGARCRLLLDGAQVFSTAGGAFGVAGPIAPVRAYYA
jgi:sulfate transport system ATP-binding protein